MAPVERVIELARAATSKIDETYDAPDVLSFTTEALEVIKAHPDLQAEFEGAFLDMSAYATTEFVEVCMHALRWPNVKREFERRHREAVAENNWRAEPVYRHYLDAFEDDWDVAHTFYAAYFGPDATGA
jgi:hypothetical protein